MTPTPRILDSSAGTLSFGPGGDRYVTKLSGADTAGAFAMCEITVAPGAGPPLHRHSREDEVFLVIDGVISFWVDGRAFVAPPGTIVYGPRNIPHTFKNRSREPARKMVWLSPAGAEKFFQLFGAAGSSIAPPDEAIVERILKLAPEFGIEILGPSPL